MCILCKGKLDNNHPLILERVNMKVGRRGIALRSQSYTFYLKMYVIHLRAL